MKQASEDLHPLLRHHLVNTLGWRSLRPLQESAVEPLLSGAHSLILAPTAGGKTEAGLFPIISRALAEEWSGTSILYVCPLKALLNNLEPRLENYFGMVGLSAAVWHGDVSAHRKKRLRASPPDCLLTTPESLEAQLVSRNPDSRSLVSNVRAIIIDEIHAFAGDDRGTHLLCVIERISKLSQFPIQRIGLSATVGNPRELLDWLTCDREEPKVVISEPASTQDSEVYLDYVGSLENAALMIAQLHRGEKRLVFCDSRRKVEELTHLLRQRGVEAHASHSSLSAESRRESEKTFQEGRDCVIVATSTLELGIDVGDLDRVIQIDAPATVASFLQRIGRTGRRANTKRNCLFLATDESALLHAAALIQLWEEGFVEPIIPPSEPFHLVAQQVIACCLQEGRLIESEWLSQFGEVPNISRLTEHDTQILKSHLLSEAYLCADRGFLSVGPKADDELGRRHFMELLSVFSSAPTFEVLWGRRSLGSLDWLSLNVGEKGAMQPVILAGQSWEIESIDWSGRKIYVSRSEHRGKSRWSGLDRGLNEKMAQAALKILTNMNSSDRWTERACTALHDCRENYAVYTQQAGQIFDDAEKGATVYVTFNGLLINRLLGDAIGSRFNAEPKADDFAIEFKSHIPHQALRDYLRNDPSGWKDDVLLSDKLLDQLKFSELLPKHLAQRAFLGRIALSQEKAD